MFLLKPPTARYKCMLIHSMNFLQNINWHDLEFKTVIKTYLFLRPPGALICFPFWWYIQDEICIKDADFEEARNYLGLHLAEDTLIEALLSQVCFTPLASFKNIHSVLTPFTIVQMTLSDCQANWSNYLMSLKSCTHWHIFASW